MHVKWTSLAAAFHLLHLGLGVLVSGVVSEEPSDEVRGPWFLKEPPSSVWFSNTTGLTIECTASGVPSPRVEWQTGDGQPVVAVDGLRKVDPTKGQLVLLPFDASKLQTDVHLAAYRCAATNAAGTVLSRNVRIKAVIPQPYFIQVFDSYAAVGSTAVLKCHVPKTVQEYIKVTTWLRDEVFRIEPNGILDGKYSVLPSGDLHIRDIEPTDGGSSYRCHVKHKVTGETHFSSTSGKLIVIDLQERSPARITDIMASVHVREGDVVILPCVAQGHPLPQTEWFAKLNRRQLFPLHIGERVQKVSGALIIHQAQTSDSGTYVCDVSNDGGNDRGETTVTVTAPLSVNVVPELQVVDMGKSATFRCVITGYPIVSVSWYKDGVQLVPEAGRLLSDESLTLSGVGVTDRGMYQCVVSNHLEAAQGAAQLVPGDAVPELMSTFESVLASPGNSVRLECTATGSPPPQVTWTVDGNPLSTRFSISAAIEDNGSVTSAATATSVAWEDGGNYRCLASNRAGSVQHMSRLNVHGPPAIRNMSRVIAVAGGEIRLDCPYYGYPIQTITWRKEGRMIPFNLRQKPYPNGTVLIEPLQRDSDPGNYSCTVSDNQGRSHQQSLTLAIAVAPKLWPLSFPASLRVGTRATLQCVATEGDLPLALRWTLDGQPLVQDNALDISVRSLDAYSSVLSITHVTQRHNGNYTCVATNEVATVTSTAQLAVNVPPKIIPFAFLDDQNYMGMRAHLTCAVSQGDLPIHFSWLKDGLPLPPALGVLTRNYDESVNSLHIQSVTSNHTGNYTCIAQNAAAAVDFSAALLVHVPPRWTVEPGDVSVRLGHSARIDCQADGFPAPRVTWMKARGGSFEMQVDPVESSSAMRLLVNGSLSIVAATEALSGLYYCQAANGIGDGLSTAVTLTILVPPRFETKFRNQTFHRSDPFRLECQPRGDAPITFVWNKDANILVDSTSSSSSSSSAATTKQRYKITSINGSASDLSADKAHRVDTGVYSCKAANSYGSDEMKYHVTILEPPDPPGNVRILDIGNRSTEVKWTLPFDGNSPILKFVVEYSRVLEKGEDGTVNVAVGARQEATKLQGLKPAARYRLQVFAENQLGLSNASDVVEFITAEEVPTASPVDVSTVATDANTIKITWKGPDKEGRNGKLRGFYIGYKLTNSTDLLTYQTVDVDNDNMDNFTAFVTGLRTYTHYSFKVAAFNSKGSGPSSSEKTVSTAEGVPNKGPEKFTCKALTSQSIHVSWQGLPEAAVQGVLKGYKVLYAKLNDDLLNDLEWQEKTTTVVRTTLHDLHKFTNYSLRVLAFTKVGDGVSSDKIFCRTLDDVPDVPAGVKAFPASKESILVAWKPPLHSNGVITKFHVYTKHVHDPLEDAKKFTVSSGTSYYEVTGLKANQQYECWVTAATMIGESPRSKMVTEAPQGPIVSPRVAAFDAIITDYWKKNIKLQCKCVGNPTPDRIWTLGSHPIKENDRIRLLPDGTLMMKNVQWNDSGNYTCHVKNGFGEDQVVYVVNILAPPSPPLFVMVDSGPASILLEWKLETDGGTNVQGYTLNYKRELGPWEQVDMAPDAEFYSLGGLHCGSQYQLYMTAVNKIGTSSPSEVISVNTNGSVPRMVSKEELIAEDSDFITLNLQAWKNEACPIVHFIIEYRQKGGNSGWQVVADNLSGDQDKHIVKNLRHGTLYYLRITAQNGAGSSVATYNFSTLLPEKDLSSPHNNVHEDSRGVLFYLDLRIIIPIAVLVLIVLLILSSLCFCASRREHDAQKKKGFTNNLSQNGPTHVHPESPVDNFAYMQQRQRASSEDGQEKPVPYSSFLLPNLRASTEFTTFGQKNSDTKDQNTNDVDDANYKSLQHFSATHVPTAILASSASLNGKPLKNNYNHTLGKSIPTVPPTTPQQHDPTLNNTRNNSSMRQPPEVPAKPNINIMETRFSSSPDKVTCRLIPGPQR